MGLATLSLRFHQRMLEGMQRLAPASRLPPHLLTGLRGEQAALFYLRSLGFTIVAQRFTAPPLRGDLDLVAYDGPTLVFVEVKTRTARDFAPADTAVDRAKQRHLRRMAAAYIRKLPRGQRETTPVRVDLVSVYFLPGGTEFEHFPGAFSLRSGV